MPSRPRFPPKGGNEDLPPSKREDCAGAPAPPPHMHGVLTTRRQGQRVTDASVMVRMRAPCSCVQGPSAPLHTPPPAHMPKACEKLARRVPGEVHTRWLDLPKAKPATRGATPRAPPPKRRGPLLSSLAREERTSSPLRGGMRSDQVKSSQVKLNQIKSSQVKSSQAKPSH